jgi:hypothetical protein
MNVNRGDYGVLFVGFLVSLFLWGFTKKNHKKKYELQHVELMRSALIDRIVEQEAMLVNIPIPLYDERIIPEQLADHGSLTIFLGYKSPLSLIQAQSFFEHQMERYGWRHLVTLEADDLILQFDNPDAYCTIRIVRLTDSHSLIFIYTKRGRAIDARHQ